MRTRLLQGEGADELNFLDRLARTTGRRTFLHWAGLTIGVVAIGCSDDDNNGGVDPGAAVDLGSGDTGVLNYAYALEQLEAAFYDAVVAAPFAGATADEISVLTDIRDHERIHRDFFAGALGASAIMALQVDFASVDLTNRNSVLTAARTFEDLGVSAYNGAGQLLATPANLLNAGRIVSVEARHAAVIRELLEPNSFATTADANGLDPATAPPAVLTAADPYITNTINASGLPTT